MRLMLQQESDHGMDHGLFDHLVVVQNEHQRCSDLRDLIEELREHSVERQGMWIVQEGQGCPAYPWLARFEGREDVHPEAHGIVVSFIERHPGDMGGVREPGLRPAFQ